MLKQAFGDDSLGQTQTFDWFNWFKHGRMSGDCDECSAQCWKMLQKSMNVICEDCKHTIDYVCNILGLSYGPCQHILSDELNIRWTAAEFVPRLLTGNQKQDRPEVTMELKDRSEMIQTFLPRL
jgi:hypothetical protein